jgi:hypothetical protein
MRDSLKSNGETQQHRLVQTLAHETDTPIEDVQQLYLIEHAKLEMAARVKTFIPVLASRRVKMILQLRDGRPPH